jgi:hypothetical protein
MILGALGFHAKPRYSTNPNLITQTLLAAAICPIKSTRQTLLAANLDTSVPAASSGLVPDGPQAWVTAIHSITQSLPTAGSNALSQYARW